MNFGPETLGPAFTFRTSALASGRLRHGYNGPEEGLQNGPVAFHIWKFTNAGSAVNIFCCGNGFFSYCGCCMSNFSNALEDVIARRFNGRRRQFGEATGISGSTLSRFAAGTQSPGIEHLERICSRLDPESADGLALAHLRDQLPKSCGRRISIAATKPGALAPNDEAADVLNRLNQRTRAAILFTCKLALADIDVQNMLYLTAKAMGGPV